MDCLRVFVHASLKKRKDRIVNVYGEQDIAPEVRLARKDKRRAAYYQFYTNIQWDDIENCHIALDIGEMGIDTCVEILYRLF